MVDGIISDVLLLTYITLEHTLLACNKNNVLHVRDV